MSTFGHNTSCSETDPWGAQVHEGIMAAATYVHSNTASALQRAATEHPGWPLLLTGHSLGGALAAVWSVAAICSANYASLVH